MPNCIGNFVICTYYKEGCGLSVKTWLAGDYPFFKKLNFVLKAFYRGWVRNLGGSARLPRAGSLDFDFFAALQTKRSRGEEIPGGAIVTQISCTRIFEAFFWGFVLNKREKQKVWKEDSLRPVCSIHLLRMGNTVP